MIPPTQITINKPLNTKKTTTTYMYGVGNTDHCLGQAQRYSRLD